VSPGAVHEVLGEEESLFPLPGSAPRII